MAIHDPNWDYSQLYEKLLVAKEKLDNAITAVSQSETANDNTDNLLIESLEALQGESLNALDCIPKWQKNQK
jgi:hypothetical protein